MMRIPGTPLPTKESEIVNEEVRSVGDGYYVHPLYSQAQKLHTHVLASIGKNRLNTGSFHSDTATGQHADNRAHLHW